MLRSISPKNNKLSGNTFRLVLQFLSHFSVVKEANRFQRSALSKKQVKNGGHPEGCLYRKTRCRDTINRVRVVKDLKPVLTGGGRAARIRKHKRLTNDERNEKPLGTS